MKHALVTGATGFIGRRLAVELRRQSLPVRALVRDAGHARVLSGHGVSLHDGRVEDSSSLHGLCAGIDTVFHLAGYAHASDQDSLQAESLHRQITVEGTRTLLDAAVDAGARRFVFLSSVKAMGEGGGTCLDETAEVAPASHYGNAKLEAERLVFEAGRRTGMHVSVLRLPLVYGPGVKGNLRQMIAAIDRRRFPPLPEVGNKRSMVHVDDVVRALMLAAENPAANGQVYIVTDDRPYSTREMYESISRALGRPVAGWAMPLWLLRLGARLGDLAQRVFGPSIPLTSSRLDKLFGSAWYSSDKIRRELGFMPQRTFFDALPEMVKAYKAGLSAETQD
jgi:nucleoside-diphosphate-sugar epimerase